MPISNTTQSAILSLIFTATAWANYADNAATTPQTNIAIALHSADPTTSGTQSSNEIAYTSYARQNIARTTGGWTVSGSSPTNVNPVAAITFAAGTGGTGTVTNFSSGKTGGGASAILWAGTVTPNITCGSGVTPQLTTSTVFSLT